MTDALGAGEFRTIRCANSHVGRFVAIYFDHPGILTVCELEIYGGESVLEQLFIGFLKK